MFNQVSVIHPLPRYSAHQETTAPFQRKNSRRNPWGNCSYSDLIEQVILGDFAGTDQPSALQAISSAPDKRLTLNQIYDWLISNISYFSDRQDNTASSGWKVVIILVSDWIFKLCFRTQFATTCLFIRGLSRFLMKTLVSPPGGQSTMIPSLESSSGDEPRTEILETDWRRELIWWGPAAGWWRAPAPHCCTPPTILTPWSTTDPTPVNSRAVTTPAWHCTPTLTPPDSHPSDPGPTATPPQPARAQSRSCQSSVATSKVSTTTSPPTWLV